MTLAKYISTLRKNNKMTQSALAKLMDVSEKEINLWERDKLLPNNLQIKRLAEIFQVEEGLFPKAEKIDLNTQEIEKYIKINKKNENNNLAILMFNIIHSVLFAVFITYIHTAKWYSFYYLIIFCVISLMCIVASLLISFLARANVGSLSELYKKEKSKHIWRQRFIFFYNALLMSAIVSISLSNSITIFEHAVKERIFLVSFSGLFPLLVSLMCSLYFFISKLRVEGFVIKIAAFIIAIITILPFGVIYGFNLVTENGYFINPDVTQIALSVTIWLSAVSIILFALISPKTFNGKKIIGFLPWLLALYWGIFVAREWINNIFPLIDYAMVIKIGFAALRAGALIMAMVIAVLNIIKSIRQRNITLFDTVCYISLLSFTAAEINYLYHYFANKVNPDTHYWAFPSISADIGIWLSGVLIVAAIIFVIKKRHKIFHKET